MAWTKYSSKKETQKPEKPRYEVFGVEVSKETFDSLSAQRWTIGGVDSDLRRVDLYARSMEIAEHLPTEAAEARAHYDAIMLQLTGSKGTLGAGAAKNGFKPFFDELSSIYSATELTYRKLADAWANRRKEWAELEPTLRGNENEYTVEKARYTLDEETYRKGVADVMTKHGEQIAALRAELGKACTEFYRNKVEDIDPEAVTLIGSGILTVEDCAAMVDQNRTKPAMQRLIAGYLTKLAQNSKNPTEQKNARALAYRIGEAGRGEFIIKAFDDISSAMDSSFAHSGRNSVSAADAANSGYNRLATYRGAIDTALANAKQALNSSVCGPDIAAKNE